MNPEKAAQAVSMKDVAKACGVSVVTVSRALRGDRNHSPETRERVLLAAEQLGYRPSPLVAALMSARGRHKPAKSTVNLALLNPGGDWIGHAFYTGVVAQAKALGFSIDTFKIGESGGGDRLRKIMQSRGVRGVIVLPAPQAESRLACDLSGFAAATIGYSVVTPDMPRVVTDTYSRVLTTLKTVEAKGYRRIGFLGTDDLDRRFQHLSTAAVLVFENEPRRKAKVVRLNLDPALPDVKKCSKVIEWVKAGRIDALVSQLELHDQLAEAGLGVPDKVGYVFLHRCDNPAVTSMDQNQAWIGRKATDVVVGMINRNEFQIPEQSQTIMIPSTWREGATLPSR